MLTLSCKSVCGPRAPRSWPGGSILKHKSFQPFFTLGDGQPEVWEGRLTSSQRTGSGSRFPCAVLYPGFFSQMVFFTLLLSHFSGSSSSPPTSSLCVVLSALRHCCTPLFPHPHLYMHTYAHMRIVPPPPSPCGFRVLILIRFELTYCQSSFSCSSEALGSYHQDLDLGPKPWARLSALVAYGLKTKGLLPAYYQ